MATPAEMLEGKIINGWQVLEPIRSFAGGTGGNFSSGYVVQRNGESAFLKAMDLHSAISRGIEAISDDTTQFRFERDLLTFCSDRRLSKIIRLIEHGEFNAINPEEALSNFNIVFYMVFELADGDIRRELTLNKIDSNLWKLRLLHNVATALGQLHGVQVAHQDVKPSNILAFNSQKTFKLSDLGRSNSKIFNAPTDKYAFPGDHNYAPPEYHYKYIPPDENDRRQGSDIYLLGSLISFLFTGLGAFMSTLQKMENEYRSGVWQGNYKDVLPFLVKAHNEATLLLKKQLPTQCCEELSTIYSQLCHPDPSIRGDPRSRSRTGRPIGIERYISKFDLLEKKMSIFEKARTI